MWRLRGDAYEGYGDAGGGWGGVVGVSEGV
jgi:hypothetical protein